MNAYAVSYVLHYDSNTKGVIETEAISEAHAYLKAQNTLIAQSIEDGVDGDIVTSDLFTITKVEAIAGVQAYAGHRSAL